MGKCEICQRASDCYCITRFREISKQRKGPTKKLSNSSSTRNRVQGSREFWSSNKKRS